MAQLSLPTLSVITPTLNQAAYLEEALDSVLSQGYPGLEYWVIDGGSTDGTLEILKRYQSHLRWISQKDTGQSAALNRGFSLAKGEILAYLNSDDRYEPGALQAAGAFFASHPQAHWLTGRCRVINAQGQEIRRLISLYKNFWLLLRSYRVLLVLDYISQPATFWRRTVVEKVGAFDESLDFSMDYDYSLRVGQHFRLDFLNAVLAAYRIHPDSKSDRIAEHFAADSAIASRYTQSKALRSLHQWHNRLIVAVYRRLQARKGDS